MRSPARIDSLEHRRLFSAPPVPTVQNGILKVWGTPGDDTIEVEYVTFHSAPRGTDTTPFYGIDVDGTTTLVPSTGIAGVHVHAGAGNDMINLIDVDTGLISLPATIGVEFIESSVALPETVFGGNGDDLIDAGYPNPNPLLGTTGYSTGPTAIYGGQGNDTISANYGIIHAGQGNDSIVAGISTTIFAGQGSDSINVGTYLSDPVYNGGGTDTVMGNDTVGQLEPG
jgi:hypothetical protein